MPLLVAEQGSPGWASARVNRVTASVAAGALGLNPNMSRAEAWRRCLGRQKDTTNRYIEWGQSMEEVARYHYEIETGRIATKTGFWVHPEHDFLGGSPDGLVDDDGCLEIKAPDKVHTCVPIQYRIQMLVQMLVTGREWCDFWSWTPNGFFLERVKLQGAEGLIRRLKAFYDTYVLTETEPPRKKPRRRRKAVAIEADAATL